MHEFNKKICDSVHSVAEDQLDSFVKLMCNQGGSGAGAPSIEVLRVLLDWPNEVAFPALDVARLAVLRADVNLLLCDDRLLDVIRRHVRADALQANQMLTFRLLANMFSHTQGETLALKYRDELLQAVIELPSLGSKNNQVI